MVQFDGSSGLVSTFQPSLAFVDLYSRPNGAMKHMDTMPWWRAEIKQNSEVYLQVIDYMLAGEAEDPADNPISQKFVHPESRGSCHVLHGHMEAMSGFSFSKSRNPTVPSGSANDILSNYFYFTTIGMRWLKPTYSLVQCSVDGVQSPILELFPVMENPSKIYHGCDYPGTASMHGNICTSHLKFVVHSNFSCFPIGVTLPNITFSIQTFDGQQPSQQKVDLGLLDADVKDSIVARPINIAWRHQNEAQVSGWLHVRHVMRCHNSLTVQIQVFNSISYSLETLFLDCTFADQHKKMRSC